MKCERHQLDHLPQLLINIQLIKQKGMGPQTPQKLKREQLVQSTNLLAFTPNLGTPVLGTRTWYIPFPQHLTSF